MAKTYTEFEAWAIYAGGLIIGIVATSVFWAYITVPEARKTENELSNTTSKNLSESVTIPNEFISFCKSIDGATNWDNTGFRQCIVADTSEKNLIVMNFLCKKYNLTLSYGSFGVKCEGKV